MRRRLLAGIIVTAVVVVTAGSFVFQQSGARTAATSTSDATSSPTPAPRRSSPAVPSPGDSADSSQSDTGEGDTSEVDGGEAESGEVTPSSTSAPAPAPGDTPPALVTLPLPDTSTAVGSLVAGFPVRVIPEAPDSVIDLSSVAAEGSQLQAALSGQTTLTAEEVLDFYRTALAELALSEAPAPALDGSSALAFTRGNNSVTLTVTPMDGGCRYAVFGTFTAES